MQRYLQVRKEALRERMERSQRVVPHSVRSLAKQVGTSHGTVGHLLTGEMERVSEVLAQRISAALGASVDDLFFLPTPSTSCDIDDPDPEGGASE